MGAPLGDRVAERLALLWPGSRVTGFDTLPGGHSGITCLAEVVHDSRSHRLVVKATPPGRKPIGRHDVLRQARVLRALADLPGIPDVVTTDESDEPFFMMRWYPGDAAEPVLGEAPDLDAGILRGRAVTAATALARLHAVDPRAVGVGDEPQSPLAEFERWTATMATVEASLRAGVDEVEAALRAAPPEPGQPRIVHGDYRLGNILCVSASARTVIDWEIWSVGDPRVDLGWFLLFCDPSNFPGISAECAMPAAGEVLAAYGHGRDDLTWFEAVARYKMAAVMGNNLGRHRAGRHHDPFQETLVPTIRHMIASAGDMVC
jgi:aminoglycoside phosphotransferase (APT) family kinase protein